MSDDDSPFEQINRQRSPFRRRYDEARLVAEPSRQPRPSPTLVFGHIPGIRLPGLSLLTLREMGPVRHALTQRVVAGMMEVKIVAVAAPAPPAPPISGGPPHTESIDV